MIIFSKQDGLRENVMTLYRYRDGVMPNTALIFYLLVGVAITVWIAKWLDQWFISTSTVSAIVLSPILILAIGLYLGHIMVLAAYLAHECMHNTIFKKPQHNDWLGSFLVWLLGASYHPYKVLKEKHLRHHTERRDVLSVDYRQLLAESPPMLKVVQFLQWLHLPGAEIFTHLLSKLSPFFMEEKKHLRSRVIGAAFLRLVFYIVLFQISVTLVVVYLLSSLVCMVVLGFMDAYQHTYTVVLSLDEKKSRSPYDRDYEEQHTFTNLLSERFPITNLLVLNFCYHNVHHHKSGEPWYRLPALHRQRYSNGCKTYLPFAKQIAFYHRYRTERVKPTVDQADPNSAAIGVAGVSFLVGV